MLLRRGKDMARRSIVGPNDFNQHPWRRIRCPKGSIKQESGYFRDFAIRRVSKQPAKVAEAQNIVANSMLLGKPLADP